MESLDTEDVNNTATVAGDSDDGYPNYNQMLESSAALRAFVVAASILLAILNLAVLTSAYKALRSGKRIGSVYLYYVNTSVAECIHGIASTFYTLVPQPTMGTYLFFFLIGAKDATSAASQLAFLFVTVDRCLYILHDRLYGKLIARLSITLLIYLAWTACGIYLVLWSITMHLFFTFTISVLSFVYFCLTVLSMVPFVSVCILYATLVFRAKVAKMEYSNSNFNEIVLAENALSDNPRTEEEAKENATVQNHTFFNKLFLHETNEEVKCDKIRSTIFLTMIVANDSIYNLPYFAVDMASRFNNCNVNYALILCKYLVWLHGILYTVSSVCVLFGPVIYALWHTEFKCLKTFCEQFRKRYDLM